MPKYWLNALSRDFGEDSSPHPGVNSTGYSLRLSGKLVVPYSGTYTFRLSSDDGSRLWINNALIANHWSEHSYTGVTGTCVLQSGVGPLVLGVPCV